MLMLLSLVGRAEPEKRGAGQRAGARTPSLPQEGQEEVQQKEEVLPYR